VALARDLLAWTQMIALAGDARRWEPKRLRLRLFAAAGRLASSGHVRVLGVTTNPDGAALGSPTCRGS